MKLLLLLQVLLLALEAFTEVAEHAGAYGVGTGSTTPDEFGSARSRCKACSSEDSTQMYSYLDRPRLHFSGLYRADVSTVNNFINNFNVSNFSLINQLVKKPRYGDFNPTGTGAFSFQECFITSVCSKDAGMPCTTDDPLVGTPLESTTGHATGKMATIDLELEHMSPIIYGMTIGLDLRRTHTFVGAMEPAPTRNVWHNVWDVGDGPDTDQFSQGDFQSIIKDTKWNVHSPYLQSEHGSLALISLRSMIQEDPQGRLLSIKFNLDHYQQNNASDPHFLYGRVTGTIGLASLDAPKHFVRERVLQFMRYQDQDVSNTGRRPTNIAPFKASVFEKRLHVVFDFGNALSRSTFHGGWNTFVLGKTLRIVTRSINKTLIGTINLTSSRCLTVSAGVCEFWPSIGYKDEIESNYIDVYNELNELLLREVEYYIRPIDHYIVKLDAWENITVNFFVNNLGHKFCGHSVDVEVQLASRHTPKRNEERALNAFQIMNGKKIKGSKARRFTSDCDGQFTVKFKAFDPGNPREIVDGEVYKVSYLPEVNNQGFTYLYFRVFDEFKEPLNPQWSGDQGIESIFKQYDYLYPIMRKFLVLSNYHSVTTPWNVHFLNLSMRLDENDPGHMPVSRDLSKAKRRTILKWLNSESKDAGCKGDMDVVELRRSLQTAIEVEHSTIPLYLYAMYSIKPGSNPKAYNLIRGIVIEEMVHMTLAANILNAVGGEPDFVHEKFIPIYPGPMPGGLHPELVLRLQPLSKNLLKEVFMVVEQPREAPLDNDTEIHNLTIGSFYRKIRKELKRLNKTEDLFISDHSRQIDGTYFPKDARVRAFPVTNLTTAFKAIDLILSEGEGSTMTDPTDFTHHDLAHYYKFEEIYQGRELLKNGKKWTYTGDPIPLDSNGIYSLVSSPVLEDYPVGSRARLRAADFSGSYLNLLAQLQSAFRGHPDRIAGTITAMNSLAVKAAEITQLTVTTDSGVKNAGPTFLNPLLLPSP
jgi:hypothetical protein